jgi:hypothetical protein
MLTFPVLAILLGMLFVLFYFFRRGVTYMDDNNPGSIWVAVVIFIIFACVGWYLDGYINFSSTLLFMYSVGGANSTYAIFAIIGLICLVLGMLIAQYKCGRMVA